MNQVLRLQEERSSLKKNSEQEVGQLWTQLESMRTSRQELGGESHTPAWHLLNNTVFHLLHYFEILTVRISKLHKSKGVENMWLYQQWLLSVMWHAEENRTACVFTCYCALTLSDRFLAELKEQLLARSARVDDIERLKTEFNEQKREIKEQNEAELESLRRYESTVLMHLFS